jgi:cytoskeletal protein RodZ
MHLWLTVLATFLYVCCGWYCSNLNVWEQANPSLLTLSYSAPVNSTNSSSSSSSSVSGRSTSEPVSWASLLSGNFDATATITTFPTLAAASTTTVSSSSAGVTDSVDVPVTEQANSAEDTTTASTITTAYGDAVEAVEHSSSSDSEGEYDDLVVTAAAVSAISAQKLADEDILYAQEEVLNVQLLEGHTVISEELYTLLLQCYTAAACMVHYWYSMY